MPLITLQNVDYSVGGPLLLEKAELSIETGERIALIGRNGAGKSTLMKLMAGELKPDDGEVRVQQGVRVTRLEQEVPHGAAGSVFDVVADGLGELGHWLAEFHRLSHAEVFDGEAMGNVQAKIDAADGWGELRTPGLGNLGLPMLGVAFAKATSTNIGAGVSGNFGLVWEHRYTRPGGVVR